MTCRKRWLQLCVGMLVIALFVGVLVPGGAWAEVGDDAASNTEQTTLAEEVKDESVEAIGNAEAVEGAETVPSQVDEGEAALDAAEPSDAQQDAESDEEAGEEVEMEAMAVMPTWSGATFMPAHSTTTYTVRNGSIKVKSGGAYISVSGKTVTAKKAGLAVLALLDSTGTERASKQIRVYPVGTCSIVSEKDSWMAGSQLALDIQRSSKKNSAKMVIYAYTGGKNQRFQFIYQNDGTYCIKCVHSGKYLDVQGGGTKKGNRIIQYTKTGNNNQKWYLMVDGYDNVLIKSKKSGMVLDVRGGVNDVYYYRRDKIYGTNLGREIIQWTPTYNVNQKWMFADDTSSTVSWPVGLNRYSATIKKGESVKVLPVMEDSRATNYVAEYSVGNSAVASVDATGTVVGKKAGTTTVEVYVDVDRFEVACQSYTCTIRVTN